MTMVLSIPFVVGVCIFTSVVIGAALVAFDNWYYGEDNDNETDK